MWIYIGWEDKGEAYYVERLRELLKQAISRRLLADVPIGFYISGGLDSSMVACYIGKYMLDSSYSFSAEIGSGELDESRFQAMVRKCVGSTHYVTKVTEVEIWDHLYQVVYQAESAVKESYDVAAFLLSDLVRRSPAKAVLTGQGSDEFFCGYVGYMVDQFRHMQKDKMTPEECQCNQQLWGTPTFGLSATTLRFVPSMPSCTTRMYAESGIPSPPWLRALLTWSGSKASPTPGGDLTSTTSCACPTTFWGSTETGCSPPTPWRAVTPSWTWSL